VVDYLLKPVSREDVEKALARARDRISGSVKERPAPESEWREKYPEAHPTIIHALEYIEQNYMKQLNRKDMARSLDVTPEYFSFLFTKSTGMTFSDFLRNYRIEKARELLESGECPKSDLPGRVGFTDARYFNQVFKSVTGMTINEYLNRK